MEVKIISATERPVEVISLAAGLCYGKDDVSKARVANCYRRGHMSPYEHASVTFHISGISRACSHQLVRHRLASYNQRSQRYCKIDVDHDDWYVTPPAIADESADWFRDHMRFYARAYQAALDSGYKPEDARYLLPEACKTEVTVTMNLRELYHFMDVRQDEHAQWEIRELAYRIEGALLDVPGWSDIMLLRSEGVI